MKRTSKNVSKKIKNANEVKEPVELVEPVVDKVKEPVELVEPVVDEVKEPVEPVKPVKKESLKDRILKNQSKFGKEYFENSSCNYKVSGRWQKKYAKMLEALFGIKGKSILDIGGAYGAIGHAFAQIGSKVTVLDISKHAISEKLFKDVKYVLAPVQAMKSIEDNSIDIVHASYVLEHVDSQDLERSLKEIKRVMKTDGICFIITDCKQKGFDEKTFFKVFKLLNLKNVIDDYTDKIKKLPKDINFFKQYNWDVFIIAK